MQMQMQDSNSELIIGQIQAENREYLRWYCCGGHYFPANMALPTMRPFYLAARVRPAAIHVDHVINILNYYSVALVCEFATCRLTECCCNGRALAKCEIPHREAQNSPLIL